MRNRIAKVLISLLVGILSVFGLMACKKQGGDSQPKPQSQEVEMSIYIGESNILRTDAMAQGKVVWTSSNEDVVHVDGDLHMGGFISAAGSFQAGLFPLVPVNTFVEIVEHFYFHDDHPSLSE